MRRPPPVNTQGCDLKKVRNNLFPVVVFTLQPKDKSFSCLQKGNDSCFLLQMEMDYFVACIVATREKWPKVFTKVVLAS